MKVLVKHSKKKSAWKVKEVESGQTVAVCPYSTKGSKLEQATKKLDAQLAALLIREAFNKEFEQDSLTRKLDLSDLTFRTSVAFIEAFEVYLEREVKVSDLSQVYFDLSGFIFHDDMPIGRIKVLSISSGECSGDTEVYSMEVSIISKRENWPSYEFKQPQNPFYLCSKSELIKGLIKSMDWVKQTITCRYKSDKGIFKSTPEL